MMTYYAGEKLIQERQTQLDRINKTHWMYAAPALGTARLHKAAKRPHVLTPRFGHS